MAAVVADFIPFTRVHGYHRPDDPLIFMQQFQLLGNPVGEVIENPGLGPILSKNPGPLVPGDIAAVRTPQHNLDSTRIAHEPRQGRQRDELIRNRCQIFIDDA